MFGLFKKRTQLEKLNAKYQKLMEDAYKTSHTNRALADEKLAKAEELMKQIEAIQQQSSG